MAFVAGLSQGMLNYVIEQRCLGLSTRQIMVVHRRKLKHIMKTTRKLTRDMFIVEQDTRYMAGKLTKETYKCHVNNVKNVHICAYEN